MFKVAYYLPKKQNKTCYIIYFTLYMFIMLVCIMQQTVQILYVVFLVLEFVGK